MSNPKITIVTATYNLIANGRKETFKQCVESVHNQTYKNFEHLIIDGASTDGTLDLIKEYENKGWIKSFSEPDKGIYDAMNKGLAKASGDYIAFLNSDDFYDNNAGFAGVIETFKNNPDADYVCSAYHLLKTNGVSKLCSPKLYRVICRMPICHQTMFTKTEILKKFGGFDLQYKLAADYDFILKLALLNYKPAVCPVIFTTFREGGASCQYEEKSNQEVLKILQQNYLMTEKEAKFSIRNKTLPLKYMPRVKTLSNYLTYKDYLFYYFKSLVKTVENLFTKD